MKANYHTHTARCLHACGTDEDYIQAAIQGGFDVIGMADHAPWPFANGFVSPIRMPMSDLPGYIDSVQGLKAKYAGQIKVLMGLESEYFPRYHDHLLQMRDQGIQYYILGQHYVDSEEDTPYVARQTDHDDNAVMAYAASVVKALETGLFVYVAHPDLYMRLRPEGEFNRVCQEAADMICQCAKENGLPIEFNLLGYDIQRQGRVCGYPSPAFWEYVRKWDNDVILGVDAHDPRALMDTALWEAGRNYVTDLGYRLIDHLDIE